ncbi:type I-G CRISPR-associated helicase/endonuclease Cas3g [Pseudonocardia asaccharolytica]|uniref:HD Cas3-type domain-containing protein n=1 Tax=Pseudonocardia asaccharolytica DSM 44247 = NBRC 16224 TaxID=1123024 RepID=A0A511CYB2_9PSEU|nr:type I-U CRISPR-associated helicase/endonuclease Cas3 [Pseudonocardia asaccharolytica]GEL17531.1 hypothetical protein PA7_13680 [Pseudonocardia asaccharolytica DSM 44247 = NBRC 16224]
MSDATGVPALGAADFAEFYRAVHAVDPFPWQESLVAEVLGGGRWPDLIDVPTGLGKTSTLDVAVFVAAATSHVPGGHRLGRRRCFFVVDRRIVVDEAYEHALSLSRAVQDAERSEDPGIVSRVAAGLRSYAPDARAGALLPVTRMRGGATWAAAWLDRPDRPGLVLGTVDQIGSRLLFRGYGVSDRRRPIDAALVGTDSLVLVDEAHLSTALLATVSAAQERDRLGVPLPSLSLVRLSATGAPARHTFALDVDAHRTNPQAWERLTAGKRLTTREVSSAKDCVKALAETTLERVGTLTAKASMEGAAPVAAVVCNTVDRARAVHTLLRKLLTGRGAVVEADCELLIGRSRPIDRPNVQEQVLSRFGTSRDPSRRAAILVATQTVEVGVNLDVDVLVSESASWDALVQRLGRLNRLGRFTERFPGQDEAAAVVIHDGQDRGPVYGEARDTTWRALHAMVSEHGGIDVSPLACRHLATTTFAALEFTRQPGGVPVLLHPTLDAWTQTAPVPLDDPPIEPFLHGFDSGVAAVRIVWRDGLLSTDPLDDPWEDDIELAAAHIDGLLTQWPPRTTETVEVPFVAVRQWMSGQAAEPISDLEAAPDVGGHARQLEDPFRVLAQRPASTGRGADDAPDTPMVWRWIDAEELRPGDLIIVPSERGGLDGYGWSPAERSPVRDVSEAATFVASRSRREATLRLDPGLPARLGMEHAAGETASALVSDLLAADEDAWPGSEEIDGFGRALAELLPDEPPPGCGWTADTWNALRRWAESGQLRILDLRDPADSWVAGHDGPRTWARLLAGPVPADAACRVDSGSAVDRDDEEVGASSVGTRPVTLAAHHTAVRQRAEEIAVALGLPPELRAVVADAAGWHDLGKADERFQIMLHGGDGCEATLALEPLAKSGMDPTDRLAWRRASRLSGLPAGARHEAWSAALVEEWLRGAGSAYLGDTDLLIHLVASHHGYARPLARLVMDREPRPVQALVDGEKVSVPSERTVSLEHPARFARLNQRYGRWGLALLETVVRCADTTVSEEGS